MKKIFYLLFYLIPFLALGQVSNGQEQQFDYGIQNLAPQTIVNPAYLGCLGVDGTMGRTSETNYARSSRTVSVNGDSQSLTGNLIYRTAMADTGVLTFAGLTTNDATHINIGAVTGYVVDNETTPSTPTYTFVNYAGETAKLVTTVGSGVGSYVMLSSAGVISFQNTFPTPTERKAKIYLGKVGHPAGAVTTVGNEPDFITSPLAQYRDLAQAFGYINLGVYPYANGANLNMNITQGQIYGDGINFVSSKSTPNLVTMGPNVAATFMIRTQTGAGGAGTTAITPGSYDVGGTITAIPGGGNVSTLQYIYAVPPLGFIVTLGQTTYTSLNNAIAAVGKETPVIYSNLVNNATLIGVLAVTKSATQLNNLAQAQFFPADKLGQLIGASAGTSTATLQSAYNNSLVPQITTSTALGAMTIKRGSASDSDDILIGQDGSANNVFRVTGAGSVVAGTSTFSTIASNGAVTAVGANARAGYFTNSLFASANNDNLTALDLSPTFTNGAFTGVKNNIIKATWNTSFFSVSDAVAAGWVGLYSVSSPSASNYIIAANAGTLVMNAPVAAGGVRFSQSSVIKGQFMPTTGNLILQNGGTFTDAGYRLDVFDNTRLNGSLTLSTIPTTSAGSYDIITRNSSTGVIEKVLSSSITDANALHKTLDESFTGIKSSTNTGTSQINGFDLTNNGTSSARSVTLTNNASGLSLLCNNNSSGYGLYSANSGTGGTAIYGANTVNVGKAFSSNNQAGGYGYYSSNTGNGIGFYSSNEYTGHSIVSNGVAGSTGLVYVGQNNGTNTFTVDKTGNIVANSITTNTTKITITTAVSITTATLDANSLGQDGRHVVIDNGVNAINLTCNGGVTTSYGKIGSGAITFVQGSGRTLVQLSGTYIMNGAVGSTATLWSSGTTDYLAINNY